MRYAPPVEQAAALLQRPLAAALGGRLDARFAALRLLCGDEALFAGMDAPPGERPDVRAALDRARTLLGEAGYPPERVREEIAAAIFREAEDVCRRAVRQDGGDSA